MCVCVSFLSPFYIPLPGYAPVPSPSTPDRINHLTPFKTNKPTQTHTGCTAWITNRIPDPLKAELRANRSLEFLWATATAATATADGEGEGEGMLTHVLDTHYESPAGMYVLALFWGGGVGSCM